MQSSELTALTEEHIGDLAPVSIRQPVGTFALTPASLLSLRAVSERADLLEGRGLDWGCGTGCLAIVAAKTPGVESLVGIDISQSNVAAAEGNAALNGVHNKTTFVRADSYRAATEAGRAVMDRLRGRLDFIIGNPPGGDTGDGLTLRRAMLSGAPEFLKPKAIVLVQISRHYTENRIHGLASETRGLEFECTIASTGWVPYDLARSDLRKLFDVYLAEEESGGLEYGFGDPRNGGETLLTAAAACDVHRNSGLNPLTKWQVHQYRFCRA